MRRAVITGHAEAPACRNPLDTGQPVVHLVNEPAPAEFAVGDDVHARFDLVGNRDAGRVVEGFLDILGPGPARAHGLPEQEQPAGRRIGPHAHCRQIHAAPPSQPPHRDGNGFSGAGKLPDGCGSVMKCHVLS